MTTAPALPNPPGMRFALALRAFFAALAGKRLPLAVIPVDLIPDPTDERLIEEMRAAGLIPETAQQRLYLPEPEPPPPAPTEPAKKKKPPKPPKAEPKPAEPPKAEVRPAEMEPTELARAVAAQTLGLFQMEGRLLDFLSEDISEYADDEVGQVVREIHRGCRKALEDHFSLEPVRSEPEDGDVTIGAGFDPAEIRLVGNVVGKPPFTGTLRHAGYRAKDVRLPRIRTGPSALVVVPAEVEI